MTQPAITLPKATAAADAESGPDTSLARNRNFVLLWAAQAISQTTQNAIFFTLMVFIESTTGSSTQMSILVLTTVLPTILFGVVAGVFVDRWPKKTVLFVTNLVRAALVLGFLFAGETLAIIFLFNLLFSITSQFFTPAEAAVIPLLVKRKQLLTANGIFNLTFTSAQLAGFVLVGPPLVKLFGESTLYIIVAVSLVACAAFVYLLPDRDPGREANQAAAAGRQILDGIRAELAAGWELLRGDLLIRLALLYVTVTTMLTLVMGMLAPGYVTRVIGIRADDSVFVLAPAGVGMLLAILVLARLELSRTLAINAGLVLMAAGFLALAVAPPLLGDLPAPELPEIGARWLLIGFVMVLALIVGVGFGLVQVPGQTILAEQAPAHMRGKVFAVQLTLGSLVSIAPLVLLGGLADLFGVVPIIAGLATLIGGLAGFSIRTLRGAAQHPAHAYLTPSDTPAEDPIRLTPPGGVTTI